jgi:hypothetical protein
MFVTHREALSRGEGLRRPRSRRTASLAICTLAVALWAIRPSPLEAAFPQLFKTDPNQATSSNDARDEAIRAIPWDKLDEQDRAKVSSVVSRVTIFRRMPTRVIQCDPELYTFLVRNPDVVVDVWKALRITRLNLHRTGPDTFHVADGAGTLSSLEFLHRSHDLHLVYAEGRYEGPLFTKQVRGRGLLLLRTGYRREPDGRYYITSRLDSFLQLEPGGAELLTKTLKPLVGKVADTNFVQTAGFLGSLSKTAEVNTRGVERLAGKLENVEPEIRDELAAIAQRVALRARELRQLQSASNGRATVAAKPGERSNR